MKRRLRAVVWFPPRNTGLAAKSPPFPWHSLSVDYFGPILDGRHILVVRCDLTRFLAAIFVKSQSAEHTITALRYVFKKHGTPAKLRTDNGTPFTSQTFAQYVKEINVEHSFSPPYHPQSNPAECAMKIVGKAIKLSDQTPAGMECALAMAIADYVDTPHPATGKSPTEAMTLRNGAMELIGTTKAIQRGFGTQFARTSSNHNTTQGHSTSLRDCMDIHTDSFVRRRDKCGCGMLTI